MSLAEAGFAKGSERSVRKIGSVTSADVRQGELSEAKVIAEMMALLWPNGSPSEHQAEVEALIESGMNGAFPAAIFVAFDLDESLIGFLQVGLRSHADGCDATRPVGFIEGWFVREAYRGQGIGTKLMRAAEAWSRVQGCREMASDAIIENEASHRAHSALGFEIVDRCVHFRKGL